MAKRPVPSEEESYRVVPASGYRRFGSQLLDVMLLFFALGVIARYFPDPPPVDAMAFYSEQEFRNYFFLVGCALVLVALAYALAIVGLNGTPGQYLAGLSLVTLEGRRPPVRAWLRRCQSSFLRLGLLMVPGPVIALFVGSVAAFLLQSHFTTTDALLQSMGLPEWARWSLHGLSFLALLAAVLWVVVRPLLRVWSGDVSNLTQLDIITSTTHVRRKDAGS